MIAHETLEELAGLYPLGGLDPEERSFIERHLAEGCQRCEAVLRESRAVTGELLDTIEPVSPSPLVKKHLLERVRRDASSRGPAAAKWKSSRGWLATAAVFLAAVIGLGLYAHSLRSALRDEQVARREAEERLEGFERRVAAISAPETRAVSLSGQGDTSGARAKAFLDPVNRRLFLYVYDLPPLPPGRTYQLWLIVEGTPVSAGTFDVAPDGTARYDAEPLPPLEGTVSVAVTSEPTGGVPQPTGPLVLAES